MARRGRASPNRGGRLFPKPRRERRRFLTAKFDRAWSALTRLRVKVGAARFRDLMVDLPDALEEIPSLDLGGVAEFHALVGSDDFRAFLGEVTEALENKGGPGALSRSGSTSSARGHLLGSMGPVDASAAAELEICCWLTTPRRRAISASVGRSTVRDGTLRAGGRI